jgi:3-methylcrotonyl-CoA carboxylase alpha subunit
MMFHKILIANRAEIACRIMRTAKTLGIATVAIYSDADRNAMHVAMADEAFPVGGNASAESYLRIDRIVAAAKSSGAEAIHPGYGFLSENADFADAVTAAGLVFVGPSASAIRAMGLKDAAKTLMQDAGVPVVPCYHGESQEPVFLAHEAKQIGYPILIKARAGGGGKGMRKVATAGEFNVALESAQREAVASFGDPHVLIEKYVSSPRHIEVQVFGDTHGNAIHLFERDCSLQRRHQKVIEEAPAPAMAQDVRAAMGDAAVRAAKSIGYSGAGTVEFIADGSEGLRTDRFWFMEMNTRLQVEHPVTEFITGIDLVEWQLRVATGEPLPKKQNEVAINGWAFEARIYAEDPIKGFLPSIGRIKHLSFPKQDVRIDSGVRQGDEITTFYDPLIAKVVVHGADRPTALKRLGQALKDVHVAGPTTNVAFLLALSQHAAFAAGKFDTDFIEREFAKLVDRGKPPDEAWAAAALLATGLQEPPKSADPFASLGAWSLWGGRDQFVTLEFGGERQTSCLQGSGRSWVFHTGENRLDFEFITLGDDQYRLVSADRSFVFSGFVDASSVTLFMDGQTHLFVKPDPLAAGSESGASSGKIVSPMPGTVRLVRVKAGAKVAKGDALLIIEAMKMEMTLSAPFAGRVNAIHVAEGDQISESTVLVSMSAEGAPGG